MSETKVPPGWVRLTGASKTGLPMWIRTTTIVEIELCDDPTPPWEAARSYIGFGSDDGRYVRESPAEVARLIAEAAAAERRARALPVMAAVVYAGSLISRTDYNFFGCVTNADAILDAIERLEGE